MHQSRKPTRKCNACGLNFRNHCGVYNNPHEQWQKHRRCPGYMNEKLLAEYQARQAAAQDNARKAKRKALAKQRHSESHHDGDRHVVMTVRP